MVGDWRRFVGKWANVLSPSQGGRFEGKISAIEGESVLAEPDVEALIFDIIPERNRETLRSEAGTEWICDVPDVGRIRCVTFRDHRGAGGIFRMIARAV